MTETTPAMTGPVRRIGVVGTGEMGRPLIDRLVAAGFEVTAFARRAEVRRELTAAGVRCVESCTAVAAGQDAVLVYVYSDEQARSVLLEDGLADAMEPGSTVVVCTTGSPRTVEDVQERVRGRGVAVLDAPATGGPAQVADGTLTVFVGGDAGTVERCRSVLEAYASTVVHFGPLGSGQRVKLLNNLLFGAHIELAVEAARLCAEFGIEPARFATALADGSGHSFALGLVGRIGSAEGLVAGAGPYVRKDVVVARAVAGDLGIHLGTIGSATEPLLDRLPAPSPGH